MVQLDGQKAFLTGKLKTKGNMMFATKLDGVLKVCRHPLILRFSGLILTLGYEDESQVVRAWERASRWLHGYRDRHGGSQRTELADQPDEVGVYLVEASSFREYLDRFIHSSVLDSLETNCLTTCP